MHTSPGSQSAVRRCSETARSKQSGLEQESFEDADDGSSTKLRLIGVCNNKKNNKKHGLTFWLDPISPLSSFLFCMLTVERRVSRSWHWRRLLKWKFPREHFKGRTMGIFSWEIPPARAGPSENANIAPFFDKLKVCPLETQTSHLKSCSSDADFFSKLFSNPRVMSHDHRMPTKWGEACNIQQRQDAMLASNPPKQKQVEQLVGGSVGRWVRQ